MNVPFSIFYESVVVMIYVSSFWTTTTTGEHASVKLTNQRERRDGYNSVVFVANQKPHVHWRFLSDEDHYLKDSGVIIKREIEQLKEDREGERNGTLPKVSTFPSESKQHNIVSTSKDQAEGRIPKLSATSDIQTHRHKEVAPVEKNSTGTGRNSTVSLIEGEGSFLNVKSGALIRGFYVFLGLSVIVVMYMVVKAIRLRRRKDKGRKYGILASSDDNMEMTPLGADDDEEDTTVFDMNHHMRK